MDDTAGLFRRQAVEYRRRSWLGDITLDQPKTHWLLTAGLIATAVAVVMFLCTQSYTSRSQVTGTLVPVHGLSSVVAPTDGVITRILVPEGGKVRAGQALGTIAVPRATLSDDDLQATLETQLRLRHDGLVSGREGHEEQLRTQADGWRNQLAVARSELSVTMDQVRTAGDKVRISEDILERMSRLLDSKTISEIEVLRQRASVADNNSALQALERQALSTRRLIAELEQSLEAIPSQRRQAQAGFNDELARLEQERVRTEAQGGLKLVSPVAGVVAVQFAKEGQSVVAGQRIFTVLPGSGELEAELMIPSRSIGFIEPGAKVLLRYQAYPYQKFGHHEGRTVRISRSVVDKGIATAGAPPGSFYRASVSIDKQYVMAYGKPERLKPGMVVEADVLGEHRRLVEWMFEPLYSLQGKLHDR